MQSMRKALAWLCLLAFLVSIPALAQETHPEAAPAAGSINLDLTSTEASVLVESLGQAAAIHIEMAGAQVPITAGTQVTPAQYLAVQQVMQTGMQTLILNSLGAAQAGSFNINNSLAGMIGHLTIPDGVTALHDAATAQMVSLTGNLINSGSYFAYTSNAAVTAASIAAQNITNSQAALISTILPTALQASLNPAINNLSLNLSAINNIVNAGVISSSANLNLYAGGSIINSLPQGASGPSPIMQAMQSLTMTAMSGQIQNYGVMQTMLGNINVQAAQTANLSINNLNGVMQALNGAINIRDSLSIAKVNTNLTGGDFLSRQMNIYSGSGSVDIAVREISGIANITAGMAHVTTDSNNLALGAMNLSGDPTYFNTGDIQITGNISVGEALTIVSGGSIYIPVGSTVTQIMAASGSTGYDITMIAGANITSGTGSTGTVQGSPPSGAATSIVTVDGASSTGGDIDFSVGGTGLQIKSCNVCTTGTAGNITLAAYSGSAGGHVIVPGDLIAGGGVDTSSITIIAGAPTDAPFTTQSGAVVTDAIQLGSALDSFLTVGTLTLVTAQPTTSDGLPIQFNINGTVASNNTIIAQTTLMPTNITFNRATTVDSIRAFAGKNITTLAGAVLSNTGVALSGFTTLAAMGNISLAANLTANNHPIALVAGGDIQSVGSIRINSGGSTGGGVGKTTMVAGANFSITSDNAVVISGTSATGGDIDLFSAQSVDTAYTGSSGSGGDLTAVAYANGGTGGTITFPGNASTSTTNSTRGIGNSGTGAINGNVLLIAGSTSTGATIQITPTGSQTAFQTGGASAANGNIMLASATPEILCAGCSTFTIQSNGTTEGYFVPGTLLDGDINVNSVIVGSRAIVQYYSGGTITSAFDIVSTSASVAGGTPTSVVIGCPSCTIVTNTDMPQSVMTAIASQLPFGPVYLFMTAGNGSMTFGTSSAYNITGTQSITILAAGAGNISVFPGSRAYALIDKLNIDGGYNNR
jgi:hypothetical protein